MNRWGRRSRGWLLGLCALLASACVNADRAKQDYLANGNRLLAEGKAREAIVEYRNALRHDAKFGEARRKLAEAYGAAGNPQAAFREIILAADLLPEDVSVQLAAGHFLLLGQRYEDAKTRAEGVLKREPRNVEALIMRANAMAGLKELDSAIQDIEEALKLGDKDERVYLNLGALRVMGGKRDEAEAAFKSAVGLAPQSVEARLSLAHFYWMDGKMAEAEAMLGEAVRIDPVHPLANRMLAALYLVTRRPAEAEQPLRRALRDQDPESRFALADYYLLLERPADAVPIFEQLAANRATYGRASLRLAQIDYAAGRRDSALRRVDELLGKEPQNAPALTQKALWQLAANDLEGAQVTATAATKADDRSAAARFALGRIQVASGNRPAAIQSLTEVLRLNPRVVTAQLMLSRLQLESGNVAAAVDLAQQAKLQQPQSGDVQLALARAYLLHRNVGAAEKEVAALLAMAPQHAATQSIHGLLLLAKNDLPGATTAFQRALVLQPDNVEALEGLLALDARAKNTDAAIARIEQQVSAHPQNAALHLVAARSFAAAGRNDRAEQSLRRVIELSPHNLTAYSLLGRMYISQQRLDEALKQYDLAAQRNHSDLGSSTMAGMIVLLQNKTEEARKRFEAILATHPNAAVAANNLAWIYAEHNGNLDVALNLARTAKAELPEVPEVNDTLGWIYYKKSLPALAVPPLEQSVAKDPANALYQFHLGLAYAKLGRDVQARQALQRALQANADFEGAALARETLASLKEQPR